MQYSKQANLHQSLLLYLDLVLVQAISILNFSLPISLCPPVPLSLTGLLLCPVAFVFLENLGSGAGES